VEGTTPDRSRLALFPQFMQRYQSTVARDAIARYAELAREYGLAPTALALGFVNSRPFVTSNIVGATNIQQLSENIDTTEVTISQELESAIDQVHAQCKNPAAA
jgi:aryl-alcohol dehydrogenase-like predicted oxidoreductase